MANYAVAAFTTALGTHAEVRAALEILMESLDTTKTIHLVGISTLSRDRDRAIGYLICDEILATQEAFHVHEGEGPLTITTNP